MVHVAGSIAPKGCVPDAAAGKERLLEGAFHCSGIIYDSAVKIKDYVAQRHCAGAAYFACDAPNPVFDVLYLRVLSPLSLAIRHASGVSHRDCRRKMKAPGEARGR